MPPQKTLEARLHEALLQKDACAAGKMLIEEAETKADAWRRATPRSLAKAGDLAAAWQLADEAPPSRVVAWHLLVAWEALDRGDEAGARATLDRAIPKATLDLDEIWTGLLLPVALRMGAPLSDALATQRRGILRAAAAGASLAQRRPEDVPSVLAAGPVTGYAGDVLAFRAEIARVLLEAGRLDLARAQLGMVSDRVASARLHARLAVMAQKKGDAETMRWAFEAARKAGTHQPNGVASPSVLALFEAAQALDRLETPGLAEEMLRLLGASNDPFVIVARVRHTALRQGPQAASVQLLGALKEKPSKPQEWTEPLRLLNAEGESEARAVLAILRDLESTFAKPRVPQEPAWSARLKGLWGGESSKPPQDPLHAFLERAAAWDAVRLKIEAAHVLARIGLPDAAKEFLARARAELLDPKHEGQAPDLAYFALETWVHLAEAYAMLGDTPSARQAAAQAAHQADFLQARTAAGARVLVAQTQTKMGDVEAARATFEPARDWILATLGHETDARDLLRKAANAGLLEAGQILQHPLLKTQAWPLICALVASGHPISHNPLHLEEALRLVRDLEDPDARRNAPKMAREDLLAAGAAIPAFRIARSEANPSEGLVSVYEAFLRTGETEHARHAAEGALLAQPRGETADADPREEAWTRLAIAKQCLAAGHPHLASEILKQAIPALPGLAKRAGDVGLVRDWTEALVSAGAHDAALELIETAWTPMGRLMCALGAARARAQAHGEFDSEIFRWWLAGRPMDEYFPLADEAESERCLDALLAALRGDGRSNRLANDIQDPVLRLRVLLASAAATQDPAAIQQARAVLPTDKARPAGDMVLTTGATLALAQSLHAAHRNNEARALLHEALQDAQKLRSLPDGGLHAPFPLSRLTSTAAKMGADDLAHRAFDDLLALAERTEGDNRVHATLNLCRAATDLPPAWSERDVPRRALECVARVFANLKNPRQAQDVLGPHVRLAGRVEGAEAAENLARLAPPGPRDFAVPAAAAQAGAARFALDAGRDLNAHGALQVSRILVASPDPRIRHEAHELGAAHAGPETALATVAFWEAAVRAGFAPHVVEAMTRWPKGQEHNLVPVLLELATRDEPQPLARGLARLSVSPSAARNGLVVLARAFPDQALHLANLAPTHA